MKIVKILFLASVVVVGIAGAENRKFIQFSDVHMDLDYEPTGNPNDMCHGENKIDTPMRYGHYKCDSPRFLVEAAILAMKRAEPHPDFILWTGDNSAHVKTPISRVLENLKFVTKHLSKHFPNVTVLPVLGNHDSSPADYFPDSNLPANEKVYADYITEGCLGDFLRSGSEASESFKKCGYYVVRNRTYDVNVTQTFIVMNTALYYNNNALLNSSLPDDPCGQFAWLEEELKGSKPNERVFIVAHVPPGYFEHSTERPFFMAEKYTNKFIDIVTDVAYSKKVNEIAC